MGTSVLPTVFCNEIRHFRRDLQNAGHADNGHCRFMMSVLRVRNSSNAAVGIGNDGDSDSTMADPVRSGVWLRQRIIRRDIDEECVESILAGAGFHGAEHSAPEEAKLNRRNEA